jgi:hypothetical protein
MIADHLTMTPSQTLIASAFCAWGFGKINVRNGCGAVAETRICE